MGKKPRNNPHGKRSLTGVSSIIPSDNNDPSPEHPPKKQKLTDNTITPPPEPPSTTTTTTTDDLRKLIRQLTHSQLTELVITASLNHPDVLDDVRARADINVTQRKLYVIGLHLKTTSALLRSVFASYGELEQGMVIKNKATPKSNRYGLVIYKHVHSALLALQEPSKVIDGRMCFSMLANSASFLARIVYVENVTSGMSAEKLLECFKEYGEVEEGPVGFDKTTGEFKGFAFIIYKNVDGAKACLVDPVKCVDGCELLCKLASNKKVKPGGGGRRSFSMLANSTIVLARIVYVENVTSGMSAEKLLECFQEYGEVEEGPVGFDKTTGEFKGFAFIIYKNVDGAKACLVDPVKCVDGHELHCRLANDKKVKPGGRMFFSMLANCTSVFARIVYVWNVTSGVSVEKLLECFQEYGEVEEGPVGFDKTTGEFKGFAYIIYKNVDGAKACLVDPVKCVDGRELRCKLAIDKKVEPGGVAALATTDTQGDVVKPKVVNSDQQSLMQGTFGSSGVTASCGLVGTGGIQRYGGRMSFSMLANSTIALARVVYVETVTSGMSAEKLLECFQEYGEVEEGPVGFDKTSGEFKGFPFIIYKNVDGAKACLVDPVKCVDGRELRCRLANDKKVKPGGRMFFRMLANSPSVFDRLVYVENVTSGVSAEKLLECFQEYGEVEEGPVGFDKTTGEFKGFPFIIYKNVGGAKACLVDPVKCIDGRELRCRFANDKKVNHGGVAALVTVDTQSDVVKPKVVNSDQQSLMQGTFGSSGVTASGGNSCGSVGGIQGYGGRRSFSMLANSTSVFARIVYVENVTSGMSAEKLLESFQEYGEVEEGPVGFDKTTGEFKGFAFIIYKNVDGAKACLVDPVKCVDGRELRCRLANDKKVKPGSRMFLSRLANSTSVFARIVYVENVTSGMSAEKLLECFQEYGEVEEGPFGFDKTTGVFKGFAFIIYKNVDGAKACLVDPIKCVDGRKLRCSLANDKKVKPGGVAALVTTDTQGGVVKPKVVNLDQQSLVQGTFGSTVVTASGGNSCGLVGLGGIQGYGGGGHGMSLSAQVQRSGDGVRPEVVNSNQQSSMKGSFASQFSNGGPSAGSSYGGNSGALGLQGGPGGSFGYGVLGPGSPLGHSQHPLNLSSGGGSVMSSFASSVSGMGLSTSGGLQPSSLRVGGGFSGDSHLGRPGSSYGGKRSDREAGLGLGFGPFGGRGSSYGGTESGGGTGLSTHGSQALSSLGGDNGGRYGGSHFGSPGLSYGGMGSSGGVELGTRVGGAGRYGGIGSGVAGLGSGFGGSDASFVRQRSGGEVGLSGSLGGPSASYGVSGSGRGVGLGGGFEGLGSCYRGPMNGGEAGLGACFNEPGARYGGMGNGGGVGLDSGLGPLGQRSRYGLSPESVRKSSGGAYYSLSSGSADQTQLQQKKYQGAHYKL